MPLLISGFHEAAAKTLAKRLHKALARNSGVPSLTQLQTMLVQAVGHADWYAAQRYWAKAPARDWDEGAGSPEPDEQGARERFDMYMPQALRAMEDSRNPARVTMGSLDALRASLIPLREATEIVGSRGSAALVDRIQDLLWKSERPDVCADPQDAVTRMAPLLERLHYEMAICLYPHRPLPPPTDPRALLLDRVVLRGDWALLENAMVQACATAVDDWRVDHATNPAVHDACAWWNITAPSGLQTAGCFAVHVLDEELGALVCLSECEASPMFVSDLVADDDGSCSAVFEEPGRPLVVLTFLKGRDAQRFIDGFTYVYRVNGSVWVDTTATPEEINFSHKAVLGLRELEGVLEGT